MEANYKTADGRIIFKVSGETPKALFSEIASLQEVFEAESSCGCCNSARIRFQARQVDDFDFYELACCNQECFARFQLRPTEEGRGLFPSSAKTPMGTSLPRRRMGQVPEARSAGRIDGTG